MSPVETITTQSRTKAIHWDIWENDSRVFVYATFFIREFINVSPTHWSIRSRRESGWPVSSRIWKFPFIAWTFGESCYSTGRLQFKIIENSVAFPEVSCIYKLESVVSKSVTILWYVVIGDNENQRRIKWRHAILAQSLISQSYVTGWRWITVVNVP